MVITKHAEELILEARLMMEIEKLYKQYMPVYFRDINRFCPRMYRMFSESCEIQNVDNSMMSDGILYLHTDKQGKNYFLDTSSELIYYVHDGTYNIAMGACSSRQYDIFDAAYFRHYISEPNIREQLLIYPGSVLGSVTPLDYMGHKIKDIFSIPILEYTANSLNELKEIVTDITDILSTSKFFRKLWFRGQRQEYYENRSYKTLNKLGFPKEYEKMPSLIPSLGRHITEENFSEIKLNMMYWIEAFKIWTLIQSVEYKEDFSINGKNYWKIVKSLEPQKMTEFVNEYPFDIEEYVYFQHDLEEFAEVLATQQYGGYTSMLDITDDLDVALFFTQSFLNQKTKRYELCNPNQSNVIYVIAEGRNTCTLDVSTHMFKNATDNGIFHLPPRIENQKCGLLIGASAFGRNAYGYRIIAKIHLHGENILTTKKVEDMFPDLDIDSLYRTYYDAEPKLIGLYG